MTTADTLLVGRLALKALDTPEGRLALGRLVGATMPDEDEGAPRSEDGRWARCKDALAALERALS